MTKLVKPCPGCGAPNAAGPHISPCWVGLDQELSKTQVELAQAKKEILRLKEELRVALG